MRTLLAIDVSPRCDYSTTRKLTALFVEKWREAHSGGYVVERDLVKTQPAVRRPSVDRWRVHAAGAAFAGKRRRHQDFERPSVRAPVRRSHRNRHARRSHDHAPIPVCTAARHIQPSNNLRK